MILSALSGCVDPFSAMTSTLSRGGTPLRCVGVVGGWVYVCACVVDGSLVGIVFLLKPQESSGLYMCLRRWECCHRTRMSHVPCPAYLQLVFTPSSSLQYVPRLVH